MSLFSVSFCGVLLPFVNRWFGRVLGLLLVVSAVLPVGAALAAMPGGLGVVSGSGLKPLVKLDPLSVSPGNLHCEAREAGCGNLFLASGLVASTRLPRPASGPRNESLPSPVLREKVAEGRMRAGPAPRADRRQIPLICLSASSPASGRRIASISSDGALHAPQVIPTQEPGSCLAGATSAAMSPGNEVSQLKLLPQFDSVPESQGNRHCEARKAGCGNLLLASGLVASTSAPARKRASQ
ncbi:MAG: hypothetical protein IPK97_06730 [Ahniella sp.]|nr:hypothetical protein [Ahniella sp.]